MVSGLQPPRAPWGDFPPVVLHADEHLVKRHSLYVAAKSGNADAAIELVATTISQAAVDVIGRFAGAGSPTLVSAHAFERHGVNYPGSPG